VNDRYASSQTLVEAAGHVLGCDIATPVARFHQAGWYHVGTPPAWCPLLKWRSAHEKRRHGSRRPNWN
jgi:hypothetical protein